MPPQKSPPQDAGPPPVAPRRTRTTARTNVGHNLLIVAVFGWPILAMAQQSTQAETTNPATTETLEKQKQAKATGPDAVDPLLQHPLQSLLDEETETSRFNPSADAPSADASLDLTRISPMEIPRGKPLKIVSWDLKSAVATGLLEEQQIIDKTWRHTFGAEMRATTRPRTAAADLNADVVLLQNVSSIRETRNLFPARYWNVIFPRRILAAERDGRPQRRAHMTALAYRYRRGLRITGHEHLDVPPARGQPRTKTDKSKSAGLAIRFAYYSDVFWVVSAHLPKTCTLSGTPQSCAQAEHLTSWRESLKIAQDRMIIGGPLAPPDPKIAKQRQALIALREAAARKVPQAKPAPSWFDGWFGPSQKIGASAPPPVASTRPTYSGDDKPAQTAVIPPDCSRLRIFAPDDATLKAKPDQTYGCLTRYRLDPAPPKVMTQTTSVQRPSPPADPKAAAPQPTTSAGPQP